MPDFYITTAIHYVNDLPHIGHIYENVVADVIARFRRAAGDRVYFLTGTDEHGQKIERSAAKQGVSPIELADRVVSVHQSLWKTMGISNDDFIRTTEKRHRNAVYELIRRIREKNPDDIYLGEHSGWYCSNEETFIPENQVVDGRCENGHAVERTTERNYFFRLSRYTEPLLQFYRENPAFVHPQTRFNEVISFVQSGLRDLSVSRTSIKWGIPFPEDPDHVVYVWMDALTNYIAALGFGNPDEKLFREFWPADIHLIGKDIIRFHAVYWPAFLMAAGVEPPKKVLGHGWWLRHSEKISKSTGNIVRPDAILDQFGPDPLRYYMLREMVFGQDADYSDESFLQRYNSDLANDLGNTLSRAVKMSASYFEGRTPGVPCSANELRDAVERLVPDYLREMEQFNFQRALDAVWRLLVATNGYIVSREPWKLHKEEGASSALARIIWIILETLRIVWVMMAPFMPHLTPEALRRLGADPKALDHSSLKWGILPVRAPVFVEEALFPRIDVTAFLGSNSESAAPTQAVEASPTLRTDQNDKTRKSQGAQMAEESTDKPPGDTPPSVSNTAPPAETTQAISPDANQITIDEFFQIELRVADVRTAERVPKSKKLIQMRLFTGDGERTVVAGIGTRYTPEELVGRKVVIVANLKPAMLMGVESNGMVLAASIDGEPSLITVDASVPAGTKVK